jgi:uncharacterized membrane protein
VSSGVLISVGVAGFIDEAVFHQLLHWHHFYDKSTLDVGLASEGFFHTGSWLCIVTGLSLFAYLQRRHATVPKRIWAGALIGWGFFELYDGLFQHKILGLHQIRCHVDVLPYDLTWNIAGGLGLLVGLLLPRGPATTASTAR